MRSIDTAAEILSRPLAERVLAVLAPDLPHGLNLIGVDGTILASTDPDRVGSRHQTAIRVLSSGRPVEVQRASGTDLPGINLPIVVADRLVAVVGLTGDPERVRDLARLVAGTVALLIEQQHRLAEQADRRLQRERLLDQLLTHTGPWPASLTQAASTIGLDLAPRGPIMVVSTSVDLESVRWPAGVSTLAPAAPAVVGDEARLELASAALHRADSAVHTVLVPVKGPLAEAVRDGQAALAVVAALKLAGPMHRFADLATLVAMARVTVEPNPVNALASSPELLDTVRALLRLGGDLAATCAELHIHRNTLSYRLNRVQQLTGRDPRHLLQSVDLLAGLLRTP